MEWLWSWQAPRSQNSEQHSQEYPEPSGVQALTVHPIQNCLTLYWTWTILASFHHGSRSRWILWPWWNCHLQVLLWTCTSWCHHWCQPKERVPKKVLQALKGQNIPAQRHQDDYLPTFTSFEISPRKRSCSRWELKLMTEFLHSNLIIFKT